MLGGLLTLDEWAALGEDDSRELVDGVLEEAELPSVLHEVVVSWLHLLLGPYFRQRGGHALVSGVRLAIGPLRGRVPDLVCFGPGKRLPREGAVGIPPDVVVEVVSARPADERRDRIAKPDDYAALGATYYWIVDPWLRSLEIFELDVRGERARYVGVLAATEGAVDEVPGLPGLRLDVDGLWSELDDLDGDGSQGPSRTQG